jgi:hypothetical protein
MVRSVATGRSEDVDTVNVSFTLITLGLTSTPADVRISVLPTLRGVCELQENSPF